MAKIADFPAAAGRLLFESAGNCDSAFSIVNRQSAMKT
jgi:hypothetical protein